MARIVFMPDQHKCRDELAALGDVPVRTIAECSCERRWIAKEDQRDGRYWELLEPGRP